VTQQARLTLYYALLAVLMAGVISGVNLINETQSKRSGHYETDDAPPEASPP